jgi:hypothetical protein
MRRPDATLSLRYAICFMIAAVVSCGPADNSGSGKEEADLYYQEFTTIIMPYKEGTERILKETQSLLQTQLKTSGNLKLSDVDSVKQLDLLKEFEMLSRNTMNELNALDDFSGSDLKKSAIEYVRGSSAAVLGAFREVALPMQDTRRPPDQHLIDSLSDKFSDELVTANEEFASKQMQFLLKFQVSD